MYYNKKIWKLLGNKKSRWSHDFCLTLTKMKSWFVKMKSWFLLDRAWNNFINDVRFMIVDKSFVKSRVKSQGQDQNLSHDPTLLKIDILMLVLRPLLYYTTARNGHKTVVVDFWAWNNFINDVRFMIVCMALRIMSTSKGSWQLGTVQHIPNIDWR